MSNKESNIEKTNFDAFIQAVGSEIEQAQVRLIVAANAQMLFHYWKVGNYILYHQQLHGWGSKIIKQLAKSIRLHYPEKKGYSERNLTYMCQFAKAYPLRALQSFIETDASLSVPTIQSVTNEVLKLNDKQFTQELTAQIQSADCQSLKITQEVPAQIQDVAKTVSAIYRMEISEIEKFFLTSPIARINWASQMVILDSSLPLGVRYWYMKQSVEMGWSSNVLKIQIETNLYNRQISNNKVNNFTATLPAPQSDLANYLLKDPYIFDLAGAKEKADEQRRCRRKYSGAFRKKSGSEFRCFSGDLWDSGSAVVAGLFAIPDPTGQTQKTKTEKSKQKSIRRQQKPSQIISCSKHCQYHFMKDVGLERKPGIADTASGLGDTA